MKYDIIFLYRYRTTRRLESFFEMKYDIIAYSKSKGFKELESFFEMKYDIILGLIRSTG